MSGDRCDLLMATLLTLTVPWFLCVVIDQVHLDPRGAGTAAPAQPVAVREEPSIDADDGALYQPAWLSKSAYSKLRFPSTWSIGDLNKMLLDKQKRKPSWPKPLVSMRQLAQYILKEESSLPRKLKSFKVDGKNRPQVHDFILNVAQLKGWGDLPDEEDSEEEEDDEDKEDKEEEDEEEDEDDEMQDDDEDDEDDEDEDDEEEEEEMVRTPILEATKAELKATGITAKQLDKLWAVLKDIKNDTGRISRWDQTTLSDAAVNKLKDGFKLW